MTLERSHEQEIEWAAQQHVQATESLAAERAHEIAKADASKDVDLARIKADSDLAASAQAFSQESQRHIRIGRSRLIFSMVGAWLGMVVGTLVVAFFVDRVANNLIEYVALITIVQTVATASAQMLIGFSTEAETRG